MLGQRNSEYYSSILLLYGIMIALLAPLTFAVKSENGNEVVVPVPNYRNPKNIAFGSLGGGSSHQLWVYEILEEMHNRGHQIHAYSRADQLFYANDYPVVSKTAVGGSQNFVAHPDLGKAISNHPDPRRLHMISVGVALSNYTEEFKDFSEQFRLDKIDLVICDSFAISCIDSAIYNKLPVVITSTFGSSNDNTAPYINNDLGDIVPTTKDQSLWERIYQRHILAPYLKWILSRRLKETCSFQRALGLEHAFDASPARFNNVPKIHSNVFGIEASRKHSPLVNLIGPVLRKSYPAIDPITKDFLDAHKKVVYVAFGQNVVANTEDIKLIMHGLLRLLEDDIIDGVVWSRFKKDNFTSVIQTPKQSYSYAKITDHPDIHLIDFAPQFGILQHPSIEFFVSHGGVTSLHESLYSRVRLFIFPFFGDQNGNARSAKHIGIADYFDALNIKYDTASYNLFYDRLKNVAVDKNGAIQEKVDRYSSYIQIAATSSVRKGADVLEESLFASDSNGELYHRRDVGYDINWIKRNNLDVYAVIVVLNVVFFKATLDVSRFIRSSDKKKVKV